MVTAGLVFLLVLWIQAYRLLYHLLREGVRSVLLLKKLEVDKILEVLYYMRCATYCLGGIIEKQPAVTVSSHCAQYSTRNASCWTLLTRQWLLLNIFGHKSTPESNGFLFYVCFQVETHVRFVFQVHIISCTLQPSEAHESQVSDISQEHSINPLVRNPGLSF